jgi:hypothetical protein
MRCNRLRPNVKVNASASLQDNGGSVALGGAAGYAFEGVAECAFRAGLAGEDGDGRVLLSESALSEILFVVRSFLTLSY